MVQIYEKIQIYETSEIDKILSDVRVEFMNAISIITIQLDDAHEKLKVVNVAIQKLENLVTSEVNQRKFDEFEKVKSPYARRD
jgi:hypothetical protein